LTLFYPYLEVKDNDSISGIFLLSGML